MLRATRSRLQQPDVAAVKLPITERSGEFCSHGSSGTGASTRNKKVGVDVELNRGRILITERVQIPHPNRKVKI